jgi:hypothetical protein
MNKIKAAKAAKRQIAFLLTPRFPSVPFALATVHKYQSTARAPTIIHFRFRFPFFLFIHSPGMVGGSGSCCNPVVLSLPVAATG